MSYYGEKTCLVTPSEECVDEKGGFSNGKPRDNSREVAI